jgi:hypothetical protein
MPAETFEDRFHPMRKTFHDVPPSSFSNPPKTLQNPFHQNLARRAVILSPSDYVLQLNSYASKTRTYFLKKSVMRDPTDIFYLKMPLERVGSVEG